jgi:hypothetical protein
MSAPPGGADADAAAPGHADRRSCAQAMLLVSKQLRALKQRALLRQEQGGKLDAAARGSHEAWQRARAAAPEGSYLRPGSPVHEALARELERSAAAALLDPTTTLPILAASLRNKARRAARRARRRFAPTRARGRRA